MKQMLIADFILQYVSLSKITRFKQQLTNWDNTATGLTFYDTDVLHNLLKQTGD